MAEATEMAVTDMAAETTMSAETTMTAETTVPDVYDVSSRFRIEIEK